MKNSILCRTLNENICNSFCSYALSFQFLVLNFLEIFFSVSYLNRKTFKVQTMKSLIFSKKFNRFLVVLRGLGLILG